MSAPSTSLSALLGRGRRRLRTVWVAATSSDFGPWLLGVAVVVALLGWLQPWSWPETLAIGIVATGLVSLMVGFFALRLPDLVVARALDRGWETDDALLSALHFAPTEPFGDRVHTRAEQWTTADVGEALPLPRRPRAWMLMGALVIALVVAILLRNPQDDVRERLAAEQETVDALAETYEELADEIAAEGSGEESDQLAERIEQLAAELRNSESLTEAADELRSAQDDLLRSVDADDLAERAAVQGLQSSLESNPLAALSLIHI